MLLFLYILLVIVCLVAFGVSVIACVGLWALSYSKITDSLKVLECLVFTIIIWAIAIKFMPFEYVGF